MVMYYPWPSNSAGELFRGKYTTEEPQTYCFSHQEIMSPYIKSGKPPWYIANDQMKVAM